MSTGVEPTFEILQFCMAMKASKKRSHKNKTNKKTKISSEVEPTFEILKFCMAMKASKKRSFQTNKNNEF
jgi:hypothetical protein